MKPEKPVRMGVFGTIEAADRAVRGLLENGFKNDQITVVCKKSLADHYSEFQQKPPAGANTGVAALSGGAIGGLLAGAGAIAAGLVTGGAALFFVGPLLTGVGAGSFIGAMVNRGYEREATNFYDQALQADKIIIAVQEDDPARYSRLAIAESEFAKAGAEPLAVAEG